MMRLLCLSLLLFLNGVMDAQKVVRQLSYEEGVHTLADQIEIGYVPSGYTAVLPEATPITGAIVFFEAIGKVNTERDLYKMATKKGLAVLHISTNNRMEFLFDDRNKSELQGYLEDALDSLNIPENNLLFAGMSLAGTRALIMTQFLRHDPATTHLPKAIVMCDSPLDFIRFHREAKRAVNLNFNSLSANEGFWTTSYLEKHLGGSPQDNLKAYIDYSPISYTEVLKTKLQPLEGVSVRVYHEPDVNWWIENRRKSYYGMNSIDLALLVNELRILGHTRTENITTHNKGYREDNTRHPHSWQIVDIREMMDWFMALETSSD